MDSTIEKTICKIVVNNPVDGTYKNIGTGFFVSHNGFVYLITASHVVDDHQLQENESFAIMSSTAFKNAKPLFCELKLSSIITRKDSDKPYRCDIAFVKLFGVEFFEKQGFGINITDIEDSQFKCEEGDNAFVYGYPDHHNNHFGGSVQEYVPPYSLKSTVSYILDYDGYVVMENKSYVPYHHGLSGSPVYIKGKLAGVFNAGSKNPDGQPVLLFCGIGQLAYLLYHLYKDH